ncbi:MAG: ABC transporter ATP-binding protein [Deltaproteobacteria bacterium]|nr:ABC transporter ATP-binding protein [Deltaproteobacteria bacterium]
MPEALAIEGLSVRFGKRLVLERVSLRAEYGTVTAILGPNGAGKSTLLKAIVGLIRCSGSVLVDGTPVLNRSPAARARLLAYVPQQSLLDSPLSCWEVVAQGRYARTSGLGGLGRADRAEVERAMQVMNVHELASAPFNQLSHGQKRRVTIARALATSARVLLLDEPTASLDVCHALSLLQMLGGLARDGHCVVTVLHSLDDALQWADHAVLLSGGRCVLSGPVGEVVTKDPVRRVMGVDLVAGGGLGYRLVEEA